MKLFHPVRVCDETPSKFVHKSIATKPTIMDMIKAYTVLKKRRWRLTFAECLRV